LSSWKKLSAAALSWQLYRLRGAAQIVLFGAEQHSLEVDYDGTKLEARA